MARGLATVRSPVWEKQVRASSFVLSIAGLFRNRITSLGKESSPLLRFSGVWRGSPVMCRRRQDLNTVNTFHLVGRGIHCVSSDSELLAGDLPWV